MKKKNPQTGKCKLFQSWRLSFKHLLKPLNAWHIKSDQEVVLIDRYTFKTHF